ncbi:tetratricopeptide repeat protein [Flavobacterium sp.]|uniref:tetratricopeptide repeat protein n=1 Tax=Flavobacterium sp. TaxID=239 RepID=UPI0026232494|nr:tetratricopeptide repeat protein [Flavobacterium sp.]
MKNSITLLLILISFAIKAQEKDKFLPKGNEEFAEKKYADAEANYRISQSKFKKKAISSYNLGTTIYKENQFSESKYQFAKAIQDAKTKPEKHKAFHNLGNVLMKEKEYQGAVEAYKNALRNNPNDEETRYNYALAKKMLKDNPPPEKPKENKKDQEKDKKEEKKDQEKDNKDQDKNKDKKDGKDNQDKDKGKGNNPEQPKPSGASKQRIENLLDAVNNEEKKVQEKVNAQKALANPKKPEKDW